MQHDHDASDALADKVAERVFRQINSRPFMPREFFDHREACEFMRISVRDLDKKIREGRGPRVHRAGGAKRIYHIQDLRDFILKESAA